MRMGFRALQAIIIIGIFTGITQYPIDETTSSSWYKNASPTNYQLIDSLVQNTSLRDKIGQLFIVSAYGEFYNQDDRRYKELVDMVEKQHIGGIIFMSGDVYGQAILTNKLQKLSSIPLWITQDMEYGAAMRVDGSTRFTPAMGVASTGNKQNAFLMGQVTAREAKALGVHQVFAPVLDINNNIANPVINIRSFSDDPTLVGEYGAAFIEGVQSEGVVATAKHFPGHGDTKVDSHLGLPVLDHDYARLDSVELVPFRYAIESGVTSIMSAHIAFPNIGLDPDLPSTLDPTILSDILTDSLHFDGLVITDGMDMRGITSKYSPGRAVVKALLAGADIMLMSPDTYTAINEVEAAVSKGEITQERINESFRKVLLWKQEFGLFNRDNQSDINALDSIVNKKSNQAVATKIAHESVTILKDKKEIVPINPNDYKRILMVSVSESSSGETGASFASSLRDFHPHVSFYAYDKRTSAADIQKIIKSSQTADLIIIGAFIGFNSSRSIQFNRTQHSFLRKLLKSKKPSVLIAFGNPYLLSELPESDVHAIGWYNTEDQTHAVAHALFGAQDITGKLTITIPGMYTIGDGLSYKQEIMGYGDPEEVGLSSTELYKIEDILQEAIRDSVFPGAVAAVIKDGKMVFNKAVGYWTYDKLKKTRNTDVFDLASITKVMSTTTAAMKLITDGKLSLDDEVWRYIPEYKTPEKEHILIKDLLLHQSGLPPFRVYVDSLKTRPEIINAVRNEPLTYETGTEYVYSDLGMILMAEIVETITKQQIDAFMRREFYYPMEMSSTYFNPKKVSRWYSDRVHPTEFDDIFERGLVQGNVHDERAYFMDGVAGHAGLFSTTSDMGKFATMLLNDGRYGSTQYIAPEIVQQFTSQQSDISGRGFGFDRKSPTGFTTAGQLSSNDTFGHLGFTGTSMWIDREKNMAVILLTNRVYPKRTFGKKISQIRAAVADAAFSAIK